MHVDDDVGDDQHVAGGDGEGHGGAVGLLERVEGEAQRAGGVLRQEGHELARFGGSEDAGGGGRGARHV